MVLAVDAEFVADQLADLGGRALALEAVQHLVDGDGDAEPGVRVREGGRTAGAGVAPLPSLSAEEEAALAGTSKKADQPDPVKAVGASWAASLAFLAAAATAVISTLVFFWWTLPLIVAAAVLLARRRSFWARWRHHDTPAVPPGAQPLA